MTDDERVELPSTPSNSWRSLVKHPEGQRELGILSDGTWAVRYGNTAFRLASPTHYVPALKFLDMEYLEFKKQYEENFALISHSGGISPFPLLQFLTAVAFKFDREGWRERALNWLSQFPPASLLDFKDEFTRLQNDKKHWQKNRHSAKRIIAAIRRSQIEGSIT